MPSLPNNFAALLLQAGVATGGSHFLYMTTGNPSSNLDLLVHTPTGNTRLFSYNSHGLYSGSGTPSNSLGGSGDYYFDLWNLKLYNKITSGTWNTGFNLQGPSGTQGAVGPSGATGVPGTGVPAGGYPYNVLVKSSTTDFDTEWYPVHSLANDYRKNLHQYTDVLNGKLLDESGSIVSDLGSGCTYCPYDNTIWVVYDGSGSTPYIAQYDLSGRFLRKVSLSGFYDIEAIDWMIDDIDEDDGQYSYFIIAEERLSSGGTTSAISQIRVGSATTTITKGNVSSGHILEGVLSTLTKNSPNEGIEALAYHPIDNSIYFFLEVEPGGTSHKLCKTTLGSTSYSVVSTVLTDLTAIKDMCYNPTKNSFIVVGWTTTPTNPQAFELLMQPGGVLSAEYSLPPVLNQVEGICISWSDDFIILTGEDSTNGTDFVVLQRNKLSNPFLTPDQGLRYYGGGSQNTVTSKKVESTQGITFIQSESLKDVTPTVYEGGYIFTSDFSRAGNSIRVEAKGKVTVTTTAPGSVNLNVSFYNKINSQAFGGFSGSPTVSINSGISAWNYVSDITFRSNAFVGQSSFEVSSDSGTYSKVIQNNSGGIPGTGNFTLTVDGTEGGTASYNYNLEVTQFRIYRI